MNDNVIQLEERSTNIKNIQSVLDYILKDHDNVVEYTRSDDGTYEIFINGFNRLESKIIYKESDEELFAHIDFRCNKPYSNLTHFSKGILLQNHATNDKDVNALLPHYSIIWAIQECLDYMAYEMV